MKKTNIIYIALTATLLIGSCKKESPPDVVIPKPESCLTIEEKKLYDLIMDYRKTKNLPLIPLSAKLTKVAKAHALDLMKNYENNNGKCNLHSWSKKGDWSPCCYTDDHAQAACMWNKPKEIAGYGDNGFEIAYWSSAGVNAKTALTGWQGSPGHNAVIINLEPWKDIKWQAIGIGFDGEYGVVWFGAEADNKLVEVCK
ncbi:MAG: CAP domain-containing protein [Cyclobacteriaceae bacterium]|nr:CAP domain-containing protein [Cyclobacteriaceae bacterium]